MLSESSQPTEPTTGIIAAARRFVSSQSLLQQDPRRVLHNEELAYYLDTLVVQFAKEEHASAADATIARMAALFYPLYTASGEGLKASCLSVLSGQSADPALCTAVFQCLKDLQKRDFSQVATRLVHDAALACYFNVQEHPWANLRRLEMELLGFQQMTQPLQSEQLAMQELLNLRFQTLAGKRYWQETLATQILEQKRKIEKATRSTATTAEPTITDDFDLEEGAPLRGLQSWLRVVYRNHINLSAIADNKANIMISVNAIMISVLLTFISYRNIAETRPVILLPVVVFIVSGLASLVFAVLSARPKVTRLPQSGQNVLPQQMAFFGNFAHLDLEVFEAQLQQVFGSSQLLYQSLVHDLYHLGRVLDVKYRYLNVSYTIFMVGLVVTVLIFLGTLVG